LAKITHTCSECKRLAQEVSRTPILFAPDYELVNLICGHSYTDAKTKVFSCPDFTFADNTTLYPFQKENVNLLIKAGLKGACFDEMGLGKTITALSILRLADLGHVDRDSIYPVAILVKAGLRHQWLREVWTKLGKMALLCDSEPDEALFKLCNIHIYSQDGLRNNENRGSLGYKTVILDECQQIKNPESKRTKAIIDLIQAKVIRKDNKNPLKRKRMEMIARDLLSYHNLQTRFDLFFSDLDRTKLGLTEVKTVKEGLFSGKITISRFHAENDKEEDVIETILHEIAHALSPGAGHSRVWRDCALSIGSDGSQFGSCEGSVEIQNTMNSVQNIIALSGTPIKNHAGEFFPVLNILRPEKFPSYNGFLRYWTRSYFGSGKSIKLGGLANPQKFGEYTSDFLIRHERKDVLPDLPAIQRNFIVNVLADNLSESYSDELKEFINKYEESKQGQEVQNVLAIMARMRHIVGLSKTSDAVEWVSEFLESSNGQKPKLTVFHHHEDVGKILFVGLSRLCREISIPGPIWLSEPGITDEVRQSRVNEFVSGPRQLLIASTLKSGEGLNLQVCQHALITERQWNSANEEQAEGRFSRIGSTAEKIAVSYLVCAGSIDELFSEIVERKRQYLGESNAALSGKDINTVTKYDETSIMKELAEKLFSAGKKKFSLPVTKVG
jgi:SNF2-related domain